jgi:hypothetical protein
LADVISQANRRRIFRLCNLLGFDDAMRHDITMQVTGDESLKNIGNREAMALIKCLSENARKQGLLSQGKWTAVDSIKRGTQRHSRVHHPKVYNLMSPEQKDKIITMSCHLIGEFDERRIDSFCFRMFKKPFKQISSDEAIKLIEIQKNMLKRKIEGVKK